MCQAVRGNSTLRVLHLGGLKPMSAFHSFPRIISDSSDNRIRKSGYRALASSLVVNLGLDELSFGGESQPASQID